MPSSAILEELGEVLAIYFQQLIKNTNECVTQFYNDGENYRHYFSQYPMMYMFYFIDEICNRYSLNEASHRVALLMNIFTTSFALSEEEAKKGVHVAFDLGIEGTKRIEEGWRLGQVIYSLAKRDVAVFTFDQMTMQQLDDYNLLLLLDHK